LRPTPILVVHDTGSTYPPLLDYLAELERAGAIVYRNRLHIATADNLNAVAETVEDFIARYGQSKYVVTDPDIALCEGCPPDVLALYAHVLDAIADIDAVGPMLRIDDIPGYYPLKQTVIKRHTETIWQKQPLLLDWQGGEIAYQRTYIDTTFGMYRKGFRFRRMCNAARIYEPYWARHLDWYIDPANMSEDQRVYLATSTDVGHWGGVWLRDALRPGFDPEKYAFKV
jgi:hypothetical protein